MLYVNIISELALPKQKHLHDQRLQYVIDKEKSRFFDLGHQTTNIVEQKRAEIECVNQFSMSVYPYKKFAEISDDKTLSNINEN